MWALFLAGPIGLGALPKSTRALGPCRGLLWPDAGSVGMEGLRMSSTFILVREHRQPIVVEFERWRDRTKDEVDRKERDGKGGRKGHG